MKEVGRCIVNLKNNGITKVSSDDETVRKHAFL